MIEATVSELRRNLQRYLNRVAQGEEVRVTRRGRMIALVVGCEESPAEARAALRSLRKVASVGDVTSPVTEEWSSDAPL